MYSSFLPFFSSLLSFLSEGQDTHSHLRSINIDLFPLFYTLFQHQASLLISFHIPLSLSRTLLFLSPPELQEEACSVPCPLDCRLSSWSTWSPCTVSCGSGLRVRSRWLREKPFNGGRPCPKLDLKNQVRCEGDRTQSLANKPSLTIAQL